MAESSVAELRKRLDGLTYRDAARLGRRLTDLRGRASADKLRQISEQLTAAMARLSTGGVRVLFSDIEVPHS